MKNEVTSPRIRKIARKLLTKVQKMIRMGYVDIQLIGGPVLLKDIESCLQSAIGQSPDRAKAKAKK